MFYIIITAVLLGALCFNVGVRIYYKSIQLQNSWYDFKNWLYFKQHGERRKDSGVLPISLFY